MTKNAKNSLIISVKVGRTMADAAGEKTERNKLSNNKKNNRRTLWVTDRNGNYMKGVTP